MASMTMNKAEISKIRETNEILTNKLNMAISEHEDLKAMISKELTGENVSIMNNIIETKIETFRLIARTRQIAWEGMNATLQLVEKTLG